MGLFSRKNKEEKKEEKVPSSLNDTMMQRLSLLKNSKEVVPQKLYVDDVKAQLQLKNEKMIPTDIYQSPKDKSPERHEIEKILMIKNEEQAKIVEHEKEKHHFPSFFAELEKLLIHKKHHPKHVATQDLINRMRDYHNSVSKGDIFFMHELEIEDEIVNSLSTLRNLESDWLLTKKQVALAEKMLLEKEIELESKLVDFKTLLLSADRFKAYNAIAPDGQMFFLNGGMRIYSIQQLIDELPKMNDELFNFHVTETRNDFALWIKGVFGLNELADKLLTAKTKEQMLEILKGN